MCHDAAVHIVAQAGEDGARHLARDHGFMREVAAATAVLFRDAGAQQAGLAGAAPHVAVDVALLGPARFVRCQLALDKAAYGVLEHFQVFGHPGSLACGGRRMLVLGCHRCADTRVTSDRQGQATPGVACLYT
ncbi:hypothetical protein D9M68_796700 [compost metagenome]